MKKSTVKSTISLLLKRLSVYEAMLNNDFQSLAYKRAADAVSSYEDAAFMQLLQDKKVTEIYGIGETIAKKMYEIMETGRVQKLEKLEREIPINLDDMLTLKGVGPKTIYKLYLNFKVKSKKDLASLKGKIQNLPGMSEKKELNILNQLA